MRGWSRLFPISILFYCRCCGHWTVHRQHRDIHSWHGACQPYPRIPQYYATTPTCIISLPQSLLYLPLFKLLPPICIFKFLPSSDFDWASGHAYVLCLVIVFLFVLGGVVIGFLGRSSIGLDGTRDPAITAGCTESLLSSRYKFVVTKLRRGLI